jgi:hypothetical protein
MRNLKTLLLISCLFYWDYFLTPSVKADSWNQETILTFSQWVQLPGITIPPGTYVFKLLDSPYHRNFVQVLSQDKQKVYATIWTIPDYRENPESGATIVFEERATGAPPAVKEWFYPDRRFGHEFFYPKSEALGLAKADVPENSNKSDGSHEQSAEVQSPANEPDITEPEDSSYWQALHQRETESEELAKADEPEGSPAEQTYLQLLHQRQLEEQQKWQAPTETAELELRELPRTASYLPLVLFSGICLLGVSFGLRLYCKAD